MRIFLYLLLALVLCVAPSIVFYGVLLIEDKPLVTIPVIAVLIGLFGLIIGGGKLSNFLIALAIGFLFAWATWQFGI